MKSFFFVFTLFTITYSGLTVFSNNNSTYKKQIIPKAPNLDSLWKIAQEEIKFDSSTMVINCSFWYNAMPGADNSQTCWHLELNDKIIYGGHHPDYEPAIAYFIKNLDDKNQGYETFVYENGWKKDHKFYFNPAGVILAIYSKKKNEWLYLKKSGPFHMGRVE